MEPNGWTDNWSGVCDIYLSELNRIEVKWIEVNWIDTSEINENDDDEDDDEDGRECKMIIAHPVTHCIATRSTSLF